MVPVVRACDYDGVEGRRLAVRRGCRAGAGRRAEGEFLETRSERAGEEKQREREAGRGKTQRERARASFLKTELSI